MPGTLCCQSSPAEDQRALVLCGHHPFTPTGTVFTYSYPPRLTCLSHPQGQFFSNFNVLRNRPVLITLRFQRSTFKNSDCAALNPGISLFKYRPGNSNAGRGGTAPRKLTVCPSSSTQPPPPPLDSKLLGASSKLSYLFLSPQQSQGPVLSNHSNSNRGKHFPCWMLTLVLGTVNTPGVS